MSSYYIIKLILDIKCKELHALDTTALKEEWHCVLCNICNNETSIFVSGLGRTLWKTLLVVSKSDWENLYELIPCKVTPDELTYLL